MSIAITFRTDDSSRWGNGKGFNLEAAEFDINNWNLKTAIEDLIANPPSPIQISSFQRSGLGFTITMSNGTVTGPIPLPILAWRWRDSWVPSVPYAPLDVFKVDGFGIFLVLLEHTAAMSFDPDATDGMSNPLYMELFGIETFAPSRATGISAAGSTQTDAMPLTEDWNIISTVSAGQGVALRAGAATGQPQWIFNAGANALAVYPNLGDSAKINAQSTNAAFTIEPGSGAEFRPVSLTQWYSTT